MESICPHEQVKEVNRLKIKNVYLMTTLWGVVWRTNIVRNIQSRCCSVMYFVNSFLPVVCWPNVGAQIKILGPQGHAARKIVIKKAGLPVRIMPAVALIGKKTARLNDWDENIHYFCDCKIIEVTGALCAMNIDVCFLGSKQKL